MMNKKRLAALAMSAVMAAGTVSIPVNAADFSDGAAAQEATVEVQSVDVTEDAVDAAEAASAELNSFDWTTDENGALTGGYTYTLKSDPTRVLTGTGTKKEVAATCENPGYYYYVAQPVANEEAQQSDNVYTDDALGHQWGEEYTVTEKAPTCEEDGLQVTYHKCGRCNKEEKVEGKDVTLSAYGHTFGADKVETLTPGDNTKLDANGKIVLVDPTKDGTYTVTVSGTCTVCQKKVTEDPVTKTLKATMTAEGTSKVTFVSDNIAASNNLLNADPESENFPENDEIVLNDCSKDAYYIVTVYSSNSTEEDPEVLDTIRVDVKAHHVWGEATVKYADKADEKAGLLTITKNAEGELVVTNNTCAKDVKYSIVKECVAEGCDQKESEDKVAPKSDKHSVDTAAKKYVNDLSGQIAYNEFMNNENIKDNKYVKVVNETATCDKAGTVAVELYCKICGEKAETITGVKVGPLGHDWVVKAENKVEATCQSAGSYDSVTACERCGKEQSRKKITIKRLPHTNELSTDLNGTGVNNVNEIGKSDASIKFIGSFVFGKDGGYKVNQEISGGTFGDDYEVNGDLVTDGTVETAIITNCAICHNHEVKLDTTVDKIVVKAVTEETKDIVTGKMIKPGSITVVATYTEGDKTLTKEITLPYCSKPMDTTVGYTGLHKDVDGVYRYYVNGEFDEDFAGIVEFNGGDYFVANGVLCQDAMGINQNVDGKWYFLAYGRVQDQHTGFAEYDGAWFYIVNGVLDENVNGLLDYDGGTFLFAKGRLVKEHNGLWQNADGKWYYLAQGQVQNQYTGLAQYDGAWFYVEKGILAEDFSGTVEYDGAKFTVKNGMVVQ